MTEPLVCVRLLGGLGVEVDGVEVPASAWRRRNVAALVGLLALAPNHRLHREQVIEALWPDVDLADAVPRLHKAAHYARRAFGDPASVVVRAEMAALFPRRDCSGRRRTVEARTRGVLSRSQSQVHALALPYRLLVSWLFTIDGVVAV